MSEEAAFLEVLKANPADDVARLVYADWLDEHNEPAKAEYLRLVVALARDGGELIGEKVESVRLLGLAEGLPVEWRSEAGSRFLVVFGELGPTRDKVKAIKAIREVAHCGLGEAKMMCENTPSNVLTCVPFEYALAACNHIRQAGEANARLYPSQLPTSTITPCYQIVAECSLWRTDRPSREVRNEARLAFAELIAAATSSKLSEVRRLAQQTEVVLVDCLELFAAIHRMAELRHSLPVNNQYESGWSIRVFIRPTPQ
jgi:uncharacterized protein (TIGR02996 family)